MESAPASLPPLVRRLLEPAAYPHPTAGIRLIETHISWVILTGDFVYKLKKPCNLGFLDFSSLDRRRTFCHEEVRLNGRFAPDLYLAAVPITGSAAAPRIGGTGPAIEWAVKLRQFPEECRLDRLFAAGRLSAEECSGLGAEIARVEDRLAVADPAAGFGTPDAFLGTVRMNLEQLRHARPAAAPRADRLAEWMARAVEAARPLFAARIAAGKVRECHGDLHLANIVLHDGRMTAFDGIEFNESLRWIDVASDVAFLAMDLEARGRPDLAAHVVSGWMEAADDHAAAGVLPLYTVYRAIVRAAVAAIRHGQAAALRDEATAAAAAAESDRYLDLAEGLTRPPRPALLVTSGISGSGKTTVAARVVGTCRAVRLRSDVERKRLAGMGPTERPADAAAEARLYDPAASAAVYGRLAGLADDLLAAGRSVVIDATCTLRRQRDRFAEIARRRGVPLVWLECAVPPAEAIARAERRRGAGGDASDATAAVVRAQQSSREPITAAEVAAVPAARWLRIGPADTADPQRLDALVAEAVPEAAPLAGSLPARSGAAGGRGG
jgi:aminoglycoside phosphotransferase family enzyme/predicted kinase